jgi:hypothetical protein
LIFLQKILKKTALFSHILLKVNLDVLEFRFKVNVCTQNMC